MPIPCRAMDRAWRKGLYSQVIRPSTVHGSIMLCFLRRATVPCKQRAHDPKHSNAVCERRLCRITKGTRSSALETMKAQKSNVGPTVLGVRPVTAGETNINAIVYPCRSLKVKDGRPYRNWGRYNCEVTRRFSSDLPIDPDTFIPPATDRLSFMFLDRLSFTVCFKLNLRMGFVKLESCAHVNAIDVLDMCPPHIHCV